MRSLMVVGLLAVVAGCAKESTAPAARVEAAPKAEAAKPAEAEAAKPVEGERIAFDQTNAKVEWTGAKVTASHPGGFNEFSGAVTLPDGDVEKAAVEVTIKTATLFTDTEKLAGHLRSADFFDVEKFPEATFKSSSIAKADEGYTVQGDLTLHGVTKRISFPAQIAAAADKLTVNAAFTINRKDFDIVYPGMPDDLIRDLVEIRLSVDAPRTSAPSAAIPQ